VRKNPQPSSDKTYPILDVFQSEVGMIFYTLSHAMHIKPL